MPRLDFSDQFVAALKKLPPDRQRKAVNALKAFSENPDHPSLHKHRFRSGDNLWTIWSGGRGDRIILEYIADDVFAVLDIGAHETVYRRMNRRS